MGSLYLGLAAPTESAAMGVVRALVLAALFGRLDGGDGRPIEDVMRGIVPYVIIMLLFSALLWYVPRLVLRLPRSMVGG